MRKGIPASLLILCGLLPWAASAAPIGYPSALALTTPEIPEPAALSLLASALLLMWAVNERRTIGRNVSTR
jgi:hypothetical protein